jgi:hypothetical protein
MDVVKGLNLFIIVLLFLFCGSVYPIIFGSNFLYMLLFFVSMVSLLLQKKYLNVHLTSFLKAIGILMFFLSVNWILTGFNLGFVEFLVMYGLILIFNIAYLALVNKENISINSFDFVYIGIVIYSFFNFIATNFLKSFFVPFTNDGYSCSHLFYVFFYVADHAILGIDIVRNQGFFWEPGVLSVVLNIFLFRLLFGKTRTYKKVLIFFTAFLIFTTFSTTGLLVMVLQFVYFLLKSESNKLKKVSVLALFIVLLIPILVSNVSEKVAGKGETSFLVRNYDALVALDIAKDNFLTGVGFSKIKNKEAQEKSPIYMKSDFTEAHGNTNSVTTLFLYLGVPLGSCYLFLLYNQKLINFQKGLFFFILLVSLAFEPLIFHGFFIFIISSYFYKPINFLNS